MAMWIEWKSLAGNISTDRILVIAGMLAGISSRSLRRARCLVAEAGNLVNYKLAARY
jgi:hypothetical protein